MLLYQTVARATILVYNGSIAALFKIQDIQWALV